MLIRITPSEMQWYGEYILQHEKFIPINILFSLIDSPDQCIPEDGENTAYGVWFQSLIYDYTKNTIDTAVPENTHLIYKRPAHCDKK